MTYQPLETPADALVRRAPGVLDQQVDGQTVVYVPSSRAMMTLNETATAVLDLVGDGIALSELCAVLARQFGQDVAVVARDLAGLFNTLISVEVIQVSVLSSS
jgi:hypothetical protein